MGFLSEIFGYILNFFYNTINNYGISIIIFSVLLRLILIPITIRQQKAMKKTARMQEKMKEIQAKYKGNPEKLNQETIELYKTEKLGPFSGCFSAIFQLVIILSVFWLVSQPLTYMKKAYKNEDSKQVMEEYKEEIKQEGAKGNYPEIQIISKIEQDYQTLGKKLEGEDVELDEKYKHDEENWTKEELEERRNVLEKLRINMSFLGLDLSKVPTQNLSDFRVYIIPILYVITSFVSIKLTTSLQNKSSKKKEDSNEKESLDELQENMQQMNNSMLYMMPIMSISISVIAPLGLALYWFISNILIIIERIAISKFMKDKEENENE